MKEHRARLVVIAAAATTLLAILPPSAGARQGAASRTTHVTVTAGKPSEFKFTLSTKTVKLGTAVFRLVNKGALVHDIKICSKGGLRNTCVGKDSKHIAPKTSTTVIVTFKMKGTYEYLCTIPGHAAAGMKGDLKVA